jgi:hypothetical protein
MHAQVQSSVVEVLLESVELSNISPDSVEATVRISARAKRAAVVHSLVFEGVTIGGVRVHVPPVAGPIRLRAGEAIEGLSDLRAVVTYQELESLEPLRRAVRDGHADVHAEVHAQLELNLFQKLTLLTAGAWVTVPVDQQVAVDVPGGPLGRAAALGALLAAEPVWIAGQAAREWRQNRTALAARVRAELPGRVVALETTYELKSQDGEHVSMCSWSTGFLIGKGELVAPVEAVEPWSFDDLLAQALDRGDVTLDESKVEVLATLFVDNSGASTTYSLQRKELRIVTKLGGGETAISASTKRRYHVRLRNSDANAVLCQIPALKNSGAELELANASGDGRWQTAAVVRLDHAGSRIEPHLWLTEARLEGARYHINDLVDSAAFGSPLWIDGGVVGLLQDEGSAVEIRSALKKLR